MNSTESQSKYFTLSQLMNSVSAVIHRTYARSYWIKAEMIKLNHYTKTNHCYPDLVEKSQGQIKAQIRATLWSSNFARINAEFEKKTGRPLGDGMNVLILARLKHDAMYGLTLNIEEIDAEYELGQLAQSKNECITRLKKAGLFSRNKALDFPLLPQRIAVISVNTSKGYQDFISILHNNSRSYKFFTMLFPALLQGDGAVFSIIEQLEQIRKLRHHFDMVAIIRGGGGDVGLACYDDYDLAAAVAQFPLPVISGIGHATNETVVEMVANYNPITPTDLAYFLQQHFDNNAVQLQQYQDIVISRAKEQLRSEQTVLQLITQKIRTKSSQKLDKEKYLLTTLQQDLSRKSRSLLQSNKQRQLQLIKEVQMLSFKSISHQQHKLLHFDKVRKSLVQRQLSSERNRQKHLGEKIALLSPVNLLKKGYSISLFNGKPISNLQALKAGDQIQTQLLGGEIESTIIKIKDNGKRKP